MKKMEGELFALKEEEDEKEEDGRENEHLINDCITECRINNLFSEAFNLVSLANRLVFTGDHLNSNKSCECSVMTHYLEPIVL